MKRIVLASKSPRRRELFSLITENFISVEADIDETKYRALKAEEQVISLAEDKCLYTANLYPDCVVIGCDTLVELNDEAMGKPKDREDAFRMVKALSGNTHTVYTGVCINFIDEIVRFYVKTEVTFTTMSEEEVAEYVSTGESDDKAGAYGMQGKASRYITGIKGDYFNVIGLPVSMIYMQLRKHNIL